MCVPGCQETVLKRLSRRDFLKSAVLLAASGAAGIAASSLPITALANSGSESDIVGHPFHRVVDLTHVITPDFPTYFGGQQLEIETLTTLAANGFNSFRWHLYEHTGTHMDAPMHFSDDQDSADEIPISKLVVPLVVVDIRAKASQNPDAQLTLDDLRAFERRYGRIPEGACVAMNSGWADKVNTPEFRNADPSGGLHFPGFHLEAAEFLMAERNANGIAVDTLSLDYGQSADFAVHYRWLPSNRWGMEAVANLDLLPPMGCTLITGGPKIAGATGGPSRLIALVHKKRPV
jgi:kynurenine formamidase